MPHSARHSCRFRLSETAPAVGILELAIPEPVSVCVIVRGDAESAWCVDVRVPITGMAKQAFDIQAQCCQVHT